MGLSPLAQGNRWERWRVLDAQGSIPARAGEPPSTRQHCPTIWVYPRSRRGTGTFDTLPAGVSGLSPLAQGNPSIFLPAVRGLGSIPARAGEPPLPQKPLTSGTVYPRSRRGTVMGSIFLPLFRGLSPLAQGNLWWCLKLLNLPGSIPARAGEPALWDFLFFEIRVYPRSRRGTALVAIQLLVRRGLSPLAQGNPFGQ